MGMLQYTKPDTLNLKGHPQFSERWVQERIAEDPSILGLGELELRDVERPQPRAGRLDLLLRDPDTGKRYEVELMLGTVDESHIIRTLEYWDIERKRYPQYDHCAVIVAEDITSRFLNVIGLFNSAIPIIALQMAAYQIDDKVILTFAKVMDEIVLGTEDEDDEGPTSNRADWEARTPEALMGLVDACLAIIKNFAPDLQLTYKRQYMGLAENGRANNFVYWRPRKQFVRTGVRINETEEWRIRLEDKGISVLEAGKKAGRLVMNLYESDIKNHRDLIAELFGSAHEQQN